MDNTLAIVVETKKRKAELLGIFFDSDHHVLGHLIGKWACHIACGHNVINRGKCAIWIRNGETQLSEHIKSLRAGNLVNEMQADKQLCLPRWQRSHRMRVPNFVK